MDTFWAKSALCNLNQNQSNFLESEDGVIFTLQDFSVE